MRAGIAFGSNLGDRLANLKTARARVLDLPAAAEPMRASSIYETAPVDCAPDAGNFFNAVIEIEYDGQADQLLRELRQIESELGRPLRHARNASRTLDLDLLYFGDVRMAKSELHLPHPRMTERRFVLEPLAEIRPELILPNESRTVAELVQCCPKGTPLVRITSEW